MVADNLFLKHTTHHRRIPAHHRGQKRTQNKMRSLLQPQRRWKLHKTWSIDSNPSEEKLSWDAYELPTRNRLRLIAEHESFIQEEREHERRRRIKEQNMKEEGFTSFNGFIQDFSRWRDSPALFHSHVGHKGAVLSFRITSDFSYIISCSGCTPFLAALIRGIKKQKKN